MKKIIILFLMLLFSSSVNAIESSLVKELKIQQDINTVGLNILNSNKIDKRIIFTYNKNTAKKTIDDPTITKRQIILYENYFKYIENDDEMAAFLSREISRAVMSYSGEWGGLIGSLQVKAAPKKYEIFADKRAVDYMVKAGYNPLGLITLINKSEPQKAIGNFFHNKISVRLAKIYEYIYFNYPSYIQDKTYINNNTYQNFLLNSYSNRALLKQKILDNSDEELKYE